MDTATLSQPSDTEATSRPKFTPESAHRAGSFQRVWSLGPTQATGPRDHKELARLIAESTDVVSAGAVRLMIIMADRLDMKNTRALLRGHTHAELARLAGRHPGTIRRLTNELRAAGLIEWEHNAQRSNDGRWRQWANAYRFVVSPERRAAWSSWKKSPSARRAPGPAKAGKQTQHGRPSIPKPSTDGQQPPRPRAPLVLPEPEDLGPLDAVADEGLTARLRAMRGKFHERGDP